MVGYLSFCTPNARASVLLLRRWFYRICISSLHSLAAPCVATISWQREELILRALGNGAEERNPKLDIYGLFAAGVHPVEHDLIVSCNQTGNPDVQQSGFTIVGCLRYVPVVGCGKAEAE